jgi:hypothetical protein
MTIKRSHEPQSRTRRKVLGSVLVGIPASAGILTATPVAQAAVSSGVSSSAPVLISPPSIRVWRAA